MSFNRRGSYDRRPDRPDRSDRPDRRDRPPRREGGGDWQPRDRAPGGGGGGSYGGGSGYGGRPGGGGGGRPYGQRSHTDEGGMSLRLDPRRLGHLKQLAAEAGMRPGDLVRQWVEERIDAERGGGPAVATGGLAEQVAALVERVAALEIAAGIASTPAESTAGMVPPEPEAETAPSEVETQPTAVEAAADEPMPKAKQTRTRKAAKRVSATPTERVALHDEMIAVIRERGPMSAGELAVAITERGRYAPPRSGKPIDAAMVSQRVSNPTYRSRFVRADGRIGLAEIEGT